MAAGALTRPPRRRGLLLLYHAVGEICPPGGERFAVTRAAFALQLQLLRDLQAARQIAVMDLASWWTGPAPADRLPVLLCFDDGTRSDYEQALPLLAEVGFTATFFIPTALAGQPGYMDWTQIRALQAAGMRLACHGHQHHPLSRLAPAALQSELRTARHMLQQRAGTAVQFLAAPYGLWNRRVLEATLCAGFQALATSRPGRARAGAVCLARTAVHHSTSVRELHSWLRGRAAGFAGPSARHGLLWLPKHILLHSRLNWPAPPLAPTASRSSS
ncbi:MAG: polysaccharide deacetylase family protein [Terriglobales bacterium]